MGRLDFLYDENGRLYGFIKDSASTFFVLGEYLIVKDGVSGLSFIRIKKIRVSSLANFWS